MSRETRMAIAIVAAIIILVVLVSWWFSGVELDDGSADTSEQAVPVEQLTPSVPADNTGEQAGVSPEVTAPPLTEPESTAISSPQGTSGSTVTTPVTGQETIRIIVREPVMVDGVDVEEVLKDKVIINEEEVVDSPLSQ
ncbi:hypothetical protein MIB92_14010 [Aestuariirhabdus sp. Z084]|uniref:hypothetical protein n=1 Tax=Aestuariirhabdus haliotis TaxID=2918751 RepID=UPI00201B3C44|nr:hypothetical protein [Aestuariirhabdus haliotis]MCL6416771.1 hypothetical protein [Aestuariirhabdus haliotis]MCL6420764.1 hypothetical protein [Aestuariirhabdus haliotis]